MYKKSDDADTLLSQLIGVTPSSDQEPKPLSTNETYQLPVRVGQSGKSLEEGDKPWIVGHFSPGVATDHNHPQGHEGVDLKAPRGTPVYPIASGEVIEAGVFPKGGNYVKVSHEEGRVVSYYAHLDSIRVQKGQKVTPKTPVGLMGDSGNAKGRGAHLHYEVKVNGSKVNPFGIVGKLVGSLSKKATLFSRMEVLAEYFHRLAVLR